VNVRLNRSIAIFGTINTKILINLTIFTLSFAFFTDLLIVVVIPLDAGTGLIKSIRQI
jgi:hypothetical protein